MKQVLLLCVVACLAVSFVGCATSGPPTKAAASPPPLPAEAWRAVHIYLTNRDELPWIQRAVDEALAPNGLNTLILEINHSFQYTSHPELAGGNAMTKEDAQALVAFCKERGVRVVPQFQCFGHQGSRPNLFMRRYPELMAPPEPDYDDPQHYHVSWNPLDPRTNEIVFALIDELIDAFQPEYFHVGMDEVMLFPDETTPFYEGQSRAEIFAKAVNDIHAHVVKEKGLTMMMWGDRLLDRAVMPYNRFEASDLDTAPAIDMIPKDIIICDWHYFRRQDYPSIPYFQEKGFRVIPASWRSPSAGLALYGYAQQVATEAMLGHMCTSWCGAIPFCQGVLGENAENLNPTVIGAANTFFAIADAWGK